MGIHCLQKKDRHNIYLDIKERHNRIAGEQE